MENELEALQITDTIPTFYQKLDTTSKLCELNSSLKKLASNRDSEKKKVYLKKTPTDSQQPYFDGDNPNRKLNFISDNIINNSLQDYINKTQISNSTNSNGEQDSNNYGVFSNYPQKNRLRSSKALSKVLKKVKKYYSASQSQKSFAK